MTYINLTLLVSAFLQVVILGCQGTRPYLHPQPLTAALQAKQGNHSIDQEWLLSLASKDSQLPSSLKWLTTNQLLYALPSHDLKNTEIETLDITTKIRKKLGEGSSPKPSPDGKWIAYFKKINKIGAKAEIWIMAYDGAHGRMLFEAPEKVSLFTLGFAWSPDSQHIAINYQQEIQPWDRHVKADEDASKTSAVDADHLFVKAPLTTIDVIDIKTSKARSVASIDASVKYLSWLNDKKLLFMTQNVGYYYNNKEHHSSIKVLEIDSAQLQSLVNFNDMKQFMNPVASPDGKKVAFLYDADNPEFDYLLGLGVVAASSAENQPNDISRLTRNFKLSHQQWSLDSQYMYVLRTYGAYKQLYKINTIDGAPIQLTNAPQNIISYALSPNGKKLAWLSEDAHSVNFLHVADSNGNNIETLVKNSSASDDRALSEVREIEWETKDYPASMRGLLVLPQHYEQGKRYPLVVDIHGGDAGAWLPLYGGILVNTSLEWQLWAAKGYAVFIPEFRSSGAFGSLAITRDAKQEHDLVNRDIIDICTGVDALISRGIVDKNRVAVIGFSAGGFRANWLLVSTHRFATVISKEGWADQYLNAGLHNFAGFKGYGGTPVTHPEYYQKNSPIYHALGARTPALFLMGDPKNGGVDEYDSVRWLYRALKEQGVETQYIKYPDEGHLFEREANRRDSLDRAVKWIDNYLNPAL
jgi:dipeptidyl aminopeptidase/acylaminoacyl peptidase